MSEAAVRELVTFIAKRFAQDSDAVEITDGEYQDELLLLVDDDDLGRIIGRRGKTAKAIRTLIEATGSELDLEIGARSEADGE